MPDKKSPVTSEKSLAELLAISRRLQQHAEELADQSRALAETIAAARARLKDGRGRAKR